MSELQDSQLCGWLFLDEAEAFWVGVAVGRQVASGGEDG
jgi:hypothetical protein